MKKLLLLALALCLPMLAGNNYTVCPSGCSYTTIQAAINALDGTGAVSSPHTITVTVSAYAENLYIGRQTSSPYRTIKHLRLRSARYADFRDGVRVTDADVAKMPTLTSHSAGVAIIQISQDIQNPVAQNGIDIATDTFTLYSLPAGHYLLREGDAVTCTAPSPTIAAPLARDAVYRITNLNAGAGTFQLLDATGALVNMTSVGNSASASYYLREHCLPVDQPEDIEIQGFYMPYDPAYQWQSAIAISANITGAPRYGPRNIRLKHNIIDGLSTELSGVGVGIFARGGMNVSITDSIIKNIRRQGVESTGVNAINTDGLRIQNNFLQIAGIPVLTGGSRAADDYVIRRVEVLGNYIHKRGDWHRQIVTADPSGACFYDALSSSGEIKYNSNNSKEWECQSNGASWAEVSKGTAGLNVLDKNGTEFKGCDTCRIEGNYIANVYYGVDSGQAWVFNLNVLCYGPNEVLKNIVVRNNRATQVWRTWSVAFDNQGGCGVPFNQQPISNILIDNNLFSEVGRWPELSTSATANNGQPEAARMYSGISNIKVKRNTVRANNIQNGIFINGTTGWASFAVTGGFTDNLHVTEALTGSSVIPFVVAVGNVASCGTPGLKSFLVAGTVFFRNNVIPTSVLNDAGCSDIAANTSHVANAAAVSFVSSTNHRLAGGSPYIASSTNGGPIGADVDKIETWTLGAIAGEQFSHAIKLVARAASTTSVTISFDDPTSACTLGFYSNSIRTTSAGSPSSSVSGTWRTFTVGTLTSKVPYYYLVTCPTGVYVGTVRPI